MKFEVEDRVITRSRRTKGKVIEVNEKWGWARVLFSKGKVRTYDTNLPKSVISIMVDPDYNHVCNEKYCGHRYCQPS